MSLFRDSKFDSMDWIGQITQPIETDLNELLSKLPDEIPIDLLFESGRYTAMNIEDCLKLAKYIDQDRVGAMDRDTKESIFQCFEFEVEPSTTIDYSQTPPLVQGSARLIKKTQLFDERTITATLGSGAIRYIRDCRAHSSNYGRLTEIGEILDAPKEFFKSRSRYRKADILAKHYMELIKTNKWRIKNKELADKVGVWIYGYAMNGELGAMANLCKLKVMTHSDNPIYSIEEEL